MPHILIVDDSEFERTFMRTLVEKRCGYPCLEAAGGAEALTLIRRDAGRDIAAMLLDLSMPGMDGRAVLAETRALRPDLPVIVVTGTQAVADVVEVIRLGAADYLVKPVNQDLLRNALTRVMEMDALRREVEALRTAQGMPSSFAALIGADPAMQTCLRLGQRAATSDITVLLTGESGVGKEMLARAIHGGSARKDKPFVAVNCGALPKELVESILFGHKKGSFTGAVADAIGKFREADGGTLFLDEVGELPLDAQVKLLRALQQREVETVGGGKPVPVNIRVIAATNRNPVQAMQSGQLREDLFYRLNVFPIHIPPLRERPGDIKALGLHFLHRYAATENKDIAGFDEKAERWLTAHGWPGNVRELENAVFRAVLLCDRDRIGLDCLRGAATPSAPAPSGEESPTRVALLDSSGTLKTLRQIEAEVEQAALAFCHGDVALAAKRLGIGKSTIYRHRQG